MLIVLFELIYIFCARFITKYRQNEQKKLINFELIIKPISIVWNKWPIPRWKVFVAVAQKSVETLVYKQILR